MVAARTEIKHLGLCALWCGPALWHGGLAMPNAGAAQRSMYAGSPVLSEYALPDQ
jgi:hypothetical protein